MTCANYYFFFKQKTAYEMRISDWSSDVCSSDILDRAHSEKARHIQIGRLLPLPVKYQFRAALQIVGCQAGASDFGDGSVIAAQRECASAARDVPGGECERRETQNQKGKDQTNLRINHAADNADHNISR